MCCLLQGVHCISVLQMQPPSYPVLSADSGAPRRVLPQQQRTCHAPGNLPTSWWRGPPAAASTSRPPSAARASSTAGTTHGMRCVRAHASAVQADAGHGPRLQRCRQLPAQRLQAAGKAGHGRQQLHGGVDKAVVGVPGVVEHRRRRGRAARRCLLPRLAPRPGPRLLLPRLRRALRRSWRGCLAPERVGAGPAGEAGSAAPPAHAAAGVRQPRALQPLLCQRHRPAASGRARLRHGPRGAARGAGCGAAGAGLRDLGPVVAPYRALQCGSGVFGTHSDACKHVLAILGTHRATC